MNMGIENSLWYKTISIRGVAVMWLCWGFAPLVLTQIPSGFEQKLLFVFLAAIGVLTAYSLVSAISKKSLLGVVVYGVAPIIISVSSYLIAGNS
jgi:hypothetical protein